jgi:hypothetical protein
MCNLASFDESVNKSHYSNRMIIGGRYGTRFASAFLVKAPVGPSAIQNCELIDGVFEESDLFVDVYRFTRLSE